MKKRFQIIPLILVFLLVFSTLSLANQYRLIRVVDGDTMVVNYEGKYEKVKPLQVNTPESVHRDSVALAVVSIIFLLLLLHRLQM